MECPYCGQGLKEGVIVCAYCARDVAFFRPLESRFGEIERQLAEITLALKEIKDYGAVPVATTNGVASPLLDAAKIATAAGIPIVCTAVIGSQHDRLSELTMFMLFLATQIPTALWVGASLSARLVTWSVVGLVVGIGDAAAGRVWLGPPKDFWRYSILVFPAMLLFVSSAMMGNLAARRLRHNRVEPRYATRLARKYVGSSSGQRGNSAVAVIQEKRVKHIAALIAAFAPILAFVGSLITAYFSYLGTIAKRGP
jgi:hypothetical protein